MSDTEKEKEAGMNLIEARALTSYGVHLIEAGTLDVAEHVLTTSVRILTSAVQDADLVKVPGALEFRLAHALALLAVAYHGMGKAVTAEGLFRTAFDETSNVTNRSDLRHRRIRSLVLRGYGTLLKDWDKRESEAAKYLAAAREISSTLPSHSLSSSPLCPVDFIIGSWGCHLNGNSMQSDAFLAI